MTGLLCVFLDYFGITPMNNAGDEKALDEVRLGSAVLGSGIARKHAEQERYTAAPQQDIGGSLEPLVIVARGLPEVEDPKRHQA